MYVGVLEGSTSVMSKPKPLYLNALSDFYKINPEGDSGRLGSAPNWQIADVHETLRTLCFGEQMASPEAPREGKFEPEPLYLKHFSDANKIALETDSDGPGSNDFS